MWSALFALPMARDLIAFCAAERDGLTAKTAEMVHTTNHLTKKLLPKSVGGSYEKRKALSIPVAGHPFINLRLNPCLRFWKQPEEGAVKRCVVNLGRGAHAEASGPSFTRADAGLHFGLGLPNGRFKFRRKFHLVLNKIVKPIADLPQFCRRQLPQFALNLLHFAHTVAMLRFA